MDSLNRRDPLKVTSKGKGHIVLLEVQMNSIQSQIDTVVLILKANHWIHPNIQEN